MNRAVVAYPASWRQDRIRFWLSRLGMPGVLGLALAGLALWGWLLWLPQQQADLAEQEAQIAHLRRQLAASVAPSPVAGQAHPMPEAQARGVITAQTLQPGWNRLWAALPSAVDATRLQSELLAAASERGIAVQSVQFRGGASTGLPLLWRQQITVPAEAPYPAVRAWLDWVLQQPAITVDALDLNRTDVMSDRVKARLQVSLWWRVEADRPVAAAPLGASTPLVALVPARTGASAIARVTVPEGGR